MVKRMHLPTRTPLDAVEAEMRQRSLDRGALRIGDTRPQLHLDDDREPDVTLRPRSQRPGHVVERTAR